MDNRDSVVIARLDRTPNLDVYRSAETVAHYAGLNYLTSAESLMFAAHLKAGLAVLDLGVGGGRTTPYLSGIASEYVGVDYSEEMIRACRRKYPALRFEVADAADLSLFANECFDAVVFSFNGMDYLVPDEKRQRFLRECFRVLKQGGTFIFSRHNPRSLVVGWDWDWDRLRNMAKDVGGGRRFIVGPILVGLSIAKLVLAVCRTLGRSIPRALRRIKTRTFWRGEGYQFDPTHGGLWTHCSVPKRVTAELNKFQFKLLQLLPEDHPRTSKTWKTRWYYYVFSRN
jgi:SAM-dependent methyltransferase